MSQVYLKKKKKKKKKIEVVSFSIESWYNPKVLMSIDSGWDADEILKSTNTFLTCKVFSSPFNCSWSAVSILIKVASKQELSMSFALIKFFPFVIVIGTI